MPAAIVHSNERTDTATTNQTDRPAARLGSMPRCRARWTKTRHIRTVAAFIGRLATALCAMKAASWSIARKM
jgi:hypothetical protein